MILEVLLVPVTLAQEIKVKKSKTPHPHVRLCLFNSRSIRKGKVVVHYYLSVTYEQLTIEGHKKKTYEKGVVPVTVQPFRK